MPAITPNINVNVTGLNPAATGGGQYVGGTQPTGSGIVGQKVAAPGASQDATTASGADLAPTGPAQGNLDPQRAADQLQAFLASAQDLNAIGALLIKFANLQQKDALQQRLASRETAKQDLLNQATDMRTSAKDIREAAITSLVISVVSAAVSLIMAGMALKSAGEATGELKTLQPKSKPIEPQIKTSAPKTSATPKEETNVPREEETTTARKTTTVEETNATNESSTANENKTKTTNKKAQEDAKEEKTKENEKKRELTDEEKYQQYLDAKKSDQNREEKLTRIKQLDGKAQNYLTLGQAVGQGLGGGANYASSEGQAKSKLDEADGSEQAALAQDAEAQADMAKGLMDAAEQLISQIIGLLKEIGDAKAEAMQSMTRV